MGLVLVVGCGGEEPAGVSAVTAPPVGDPVHAPLVPTPVAALPRETAERVAEYDFSGGAEGVTIDAARVRKVRGHGGKRIARIRSDDAPVRIALHGPFESASFNRLRLSGWFLSAASTIQVLCMRGGEVVLRSEPVVVQDLFEKVWLEVDLPGLDLQPEPLDSIDVLVTSGRPVDLAVVELWSVPLADFLSPVAGESVLHVAGEFRRAVVARTGESLAVRVPGASAGHLLWSVGIPAALRRAPGLRLRVSTPAGAGEPQSAEFEIDSDPASAEAWQEFELAFGEDSRGERSIHFEFLADDEVAAVCALAEMRAVRRQQRPRTVLLVTSDTHRADGIGRAAHALEVETPTLDALADRGTLFTSCWSTTNITQPSHATILTGIHPRDTGHVTNTGSLLEEARTLAETFRDAGFRTFSSVSVFHLGAHSGLGQGFDRMSAPPVGVWDAEQTIGALQSWLPSARGEPLFVWLHLFDAHTPYGPPDPYDRKYYASAKDPFDANLPASGLCERCLPGEYRELRDLDYARAQYRAEIDYLDHALGGLLAAPRLSNALVAFTSDHGEVLRGDVSLFNHGVLVPDTLRVPLILAGPGVPAGARRADAVTHLDLGRTLLDLAGLAETSFPGRALLSAGEAPESSPGESSAKATGGPVFALSADGKAAAISAGGWYLVLYLRAHEGPFEGEVERHAVELYRLGDEAEHLVDVAAQEPEQVRRLRAALVEWLGQAVPARLASHVPPPEALAARLAELGYASDPDWAPEDAWIDPECECERCEASR